MKRNLDFKRLLKRWNAKNNLAVLALIGLLLVVISVPTETDTKNDGTDAEDTEEETDDGGAEDYARQMEERLETILEKTDGVGAVSVMITLKSDGESIVEKDVSDSASASSGSDDSTEQTDRSETTVYEERSDGTQTPYVSEQTTPQIDGVAIVADGGGDPETVETVIDAVKALFDVDTHKIKVMKRKSS